MFSDELIRQIENLDVDAMLEELKDEIDFDMLFGKVPVEDDDPLFELKTFYNDFLTGFDFEEIKRYYQDSDGDEPIDMIVQSYFDEKISSENNEKAKFDLYNDYLIAFFYYHLNNSQFDEALSHIMQLGILASNCDGEGNVIESKPRSVEIHYQIEQFRLSNPTFDFDNSYDLAIENFKVDHWLNNEREVYDAINELLS